LRVEGIRQEGFGVNKSPVFFVAVANEGPVAANNVAIDIKVHLLDGMTEYTGGEQLFTIPASGKLEHFIKSGFVLNANVLAQINDNGSLLRITGHVRRGKIDVPYCYKYNPGDVPGMPMFIPCDMDTRRTVNAAMGAGSIALAGSVVNIKLPAIGPTSKTHPPAVSADSGVEGERPSAPSDS
jgi:hypothetical protein